MNFLSDEMEYTSKKLETFKTSLLYLLRVHRNRRKKKKKSSQIRQKPKNKGKKRRLRARRRKEKRRKKGILYFQEPMDIWTKKIERVSSCDRTSIRLNPHAERSNITCFSSNSFVQPRVKRQISPDSIKAYETAIKNRREKMKKSITYPKKTKNQSFIYNRHQAVQS